MKQYIPQIKEKVPVIAVTSAWETLPGILMDIIARFNLKTNIALEFGVERGYSTTALAHYFNKVIGVDKWDWKMDEEWAYPIVRKQLERWPNITLVQSSYQDFIKKDNNRYDLIHVDVGYDTYEYDTTFECGDWALAHSDCVIFHDTLSFPGVMKACKELSIKHNYDFYNYKEEIGPAGIHCGLGILIK